jgi:hypothetical protein
MKPPLYCKYIQVAKDDGCIGEAEKAQRSRNQAYSSLISVQAWLVHGILLSCSLLLFLLTWLKVQHSTSTAGSYADIAWCKLRFDYFFSNGNIANISPQLPYWTKYTLIRLDITRLFNFQPNILQNLRGLPGGL